VAVEVCGGIPSSGIRNGITSQMGIEEE
jgi:hypothetical protein